MPGITKSYRLTADGSQVKREFGEVGRAGEQMAQKIRGGAAAMSPALRALDATASEFKGTLESNAAAAGGLGNVLRSIGPVGFAAAAGVGALVLGFNQLNGASRAATDTLGEIYTASLRLNTSVEFLQEWRYAMVQTGEDARVVDATLGRFAVKLGQLTTSPAGELRQKLSLFGFTEADIQQMRTIEDALPVIADRIRDLGTAAQDAALLEALGLKEMQPLLQQGADAINNLRQQARDMGIVLDEEVIRRGYNLGGAWDAAAYALDITFKQAMIDAAPLFIETLRFFREMAQAASDLVDQFQRLEDRSLSAMGSRLSEIGRERARLREVFPARRGEVDPLAGGDASRNPAGSLGQILFRSTLPGATAADRAANLPGARDRFAALNAEAARLTAEFTRRDAARTLPGFSGGGLVGALPGAPDPRIAQAQAFIERLREEARVREELLGLQQRFPGASEEENRARLQLLDTLRELEELRAQGLISSDEELNRLREAATANYNYATATRAAAEAQRQLQDIQRRVDSFRNSIETPQQRLAREEAERRAIYRDSQATNDPLTSGELEAGLRRVREEYEKLAAAQYEASLEGQVLRGIIEGQVRSFEDLTRIIAQMGLDAFTRELLAGGVRGEGGVSGFFTRVLNRFGDSIGGVSDGQRTGAGLGDKVLGGGIDALSASARQASDELAKSLSPSIAETVVKFGLSTTATTAETTAKGVATSSLFVLTKAAQAAASALAHVGAEGDGGGKGLVSSIFKSVFKGPGRMGGGDVYGGARYPVVEDGRPELLLLGGKGQVFSNDTVEGLVSLSRLAQRGASAGASAGGAAPPRVTVVLRDESGARVSVEEQSASIGADGGLDIEVVLGRYTEGNIARGGVDRALGARYGLRPRRTRRG